MNFLSQYRQQIWLVLACSILPLSVTARYVEFQDSLPAANRSHLEKADPAPAPSDESAVHSVRSFTLVSTCLPVALTLLFLRSFLPFLWVCALACYGLLVSFALVALTGNTIDPVMAVLPLLVLVLGLGVSFHLVNYWRFAKLEGLADAPVEAWNLAWKPCTLGVLASALSLGSLLVTDLAPMVQLGLCATIGSLVLLALIFLVLPSGLSDWTPRSKSPPSKKGHDAGEQETAGVPRILFWTGFARGIQRHNVPVAAVSFGLFVLVAGGLIGWHPRIEAEQFALFDGSLLRENTQPADQQQSEEDPLAAGTPESEEGEQETEAEDRKAIDRTNPSYDTAKRAIASMHRRQAIQRQVFLGIAVTCALSAGIVIVHVWSVPAGLIAMLPSLAAVAAMYGALVWVRFPLDLGALLAAGVSLGMAVAGTLHLLTWFHYGVREGLAAEEASVFALVWCGPAIAKTALVGGLGFLLLARWPSSPLASFGLLLAGTHGAAMLGQLVLLPALLAGPLGTVIGGTARGGSGAFPDSIAALIRRLRLTVDKDSVVPIPLATLCPTGSLEFDLYIHPDPNGPPELYRKRNSPFSAEDLERLHDQGIRTLQVSIDGHEIYKQRLRDDLDLILSNESTSPMLRYKLLHDVGSHLLASTYQRGNTDATVREASEVGSRLVSLVSNSDLVLFDLFRIMSHDAGTYTHVMNVSTYCLALAEQLGFHDPQELERIAIGALLHDIGKLYVPVEIINKKGSLSQQDWELMRLHPQMGYRELCLRGDLDEGQLMMVYGHHERLDGGGYPQGLSGRDIHERARLCAVADVFDAMTCQRSYREPISKTDALEFLEDEAKARLDRDMVLCMKSAILTSEMSMARS